MILRAINSGRVLYIVQNIFLNRLKNLYNYYIFSFFGKNMCSKYTYIDKGQLCHFFRMIMIFIDNNYLS